MFLKEKIYTILINELMEEDGCPFCLAEKVFEKNALEYFLGPAMMEPDVRIMTNKKGFCRTHSEMMLSDKNKLSLALTLHTRIIEVMGMLSSNKRVTTGCCVCDRIENNFTKFASNFADMLKSDEFIQKYKDKKGVCLKHYLLLSKFSSKKVSKAIKEVLVSSLSESEKELAAFCRSFDYRSNDEIVADAPERALNKLV